MDWSMLIYAGVGFLLRHFFAGSGIALPMLPAIPSPATPPPTPVPADNSHLGATLRSLILELLTQKLATGVRAAPPAAANPAGTPLQPPLA